MQFFETPENRLPDGAELQRIKTQDGYVLRGLVAPKRPEAALRGTVVVLNGRGEFLERYFETLRDLQARGFHVATLDWRGQGGSERMLRDRMRGYVRSYRNYDEDLRALMEGVVLKNCPGPYYVLAHSTGGHVMLRNVLHKGWFSKAIATSPLLGLNYGNWPPAIANVISNILMALGLGSTYVPGYKNGPFLLEKFEGNILTSEERRWARDLRTLYEHPELGLGGPTQAWLNATIRSLRQLHGRSFRSGLMCPVMIVLAGREKVVDNKAAHRFMAQVPGVAHVTLHSALHEILMERDAVRSEFFAVLDSYFVPEPPAGSTKINL